MMRRPRRIYHSPGWNKDYPRIQILTIEELLHNAEMKMPPNEVENRRLKEELKGVLGKAYDRL